MALYLVQGGRSPSESQIWEGQWPWSWPWAAGTVPWNSPAASQEAGFMESQRERLYTQNVNADPGLALAVHMCDGDG